MDRRERPQVVANFARTADGKISTRELTPSGFGSKRDLRRLLEIRASGDAVIVGRGTLESDRMSLTLRDEDLRKSRRDAGKPEEPLRVVISNRGDLNPEWQIFQTKGARRVVFSTEAMTSHTRRLLEPLADLRIESGDTVDLKKMLRVLRQEYSVRSLVCEGGPTLLRSLVEIGAIDILHLTIVPVIFGGAGAPTLTGISPEFFASRVQLRTRSMEVVDNECFLTYRVLPALAS
jgi:riboflavin-specific deaminase-like protein